MGREWPNEAALPSLYAVAGQSELVVSRPANTNHYAHNIPTFFCPVLNTNKGTILQRLKTAGKIVIPSLRVMGTFSGARVEALGSGLPLLREDLGVSGAAERETI